MTTEKIHQITKSDLRQIAYLHIYGKKNSRENFNQDSKFRFFLDKVKHFYQFDKKSIIVERDENNLISGVLIYTYDEKKFNEFSSPYHLRFYIKLLKIFLGLYGFDFKKFFLASKSMLGFNIKQINKNITSDSSNFAKIWVLIVAEEDRNKGIASKLLQKCIEETKKRGIKSIIVTVKKDNIPAIKTYTKNGFTTIGECFESSGKSYIMEKSN